MQSCCAGITHLGKESGNYRGQATDRVAFARSFPAIQFVIIRQVQSGSNSAVECDLAKVEVAGSNPVSRSSFHPKVLHPRCRRGFSVFGFPGARYPSGKGEVCKTFMRRFDSDPRLHQNTRINPALRYIR